MYEGAAWSLSCEGLRASLCDLVSEDTELLHSSYRTVSSDITTPAHKLGSEVVLFLNAEKRRIGLYIHFETVSNKNSRLKIEIILNVCVHAYSIYTVPILHRKVKLPGLWWRLRGWRKQTVHRVSREFFYIIRFLYFILFYLFRVVSLKKEATSLLQVQCTLIT